MNKLIETIDENIKSIKPLLNGEDTYYKVLKRLNILKFRASDERYGKKIILENNEKAINEKKLILENIEMINRITDDITLYEKEFAYFLKDSSYYGVNQQDYKVLFNYLKS